MEFRKESMSGFVTVSQFIAKDNFATKNRLRKSSGERVEEGREKPPRLSIKTHNFLVDHCADERKM